MLMNPLAAVLCGAVAEAHSIVVAAEDKVLAAGADIPDEDRDRTATNTVRMARNVSTRRNKYVGMRTCIKVQYLCEHQVAPRACQTG